MERIVIWVVAIAAVAYFFGWWGLIFMLFLAIVFG
jgi:hypothetical protein